MTDSIATTDQKWTQAETFRFNSYEEAKVKFDSLSAERKRIRRRRATRHWDVVVYAPLKKKAAPAPEPVTEEATVTEQPKKGKKGRKDRGGASA